MRTYARNVRRIWDGIDYQAPKRQCLDRSTMACDNEDTLERAIREASVAMSSSPSRKNSTIFSAESQDDETATPPSSPPPRLPSPVIKARKPTFSSMKRKRDASTDDAEPLAEVINSSARSSIAPRPPTLVQMRIDLGGETRRSCSECGMEYVPSSEEDATLHRMYHNMDKDGVELGKSFMKSAMKWVYEVPHIQGSVVVVDRKIAPPARKVVQKVLGMVTKELSAADIDEHTLWSQKSLADESKVAGQDVRQSEAEKRNEQRSDRYKVFLHVINGKCVAACLAERITKAHRVKAEPAPPTDGPAAKSDHQSSSLSIEEDTVPAIVGVSRIWTSRPFRRKGIANNLLDCVLNQFIYGMDIDKDEIAFSQPTASGCALARAWYGEPSGWLVYNES